MTHPAYVFAPYRLLPQQRQLLWGDEQIKLGGRAFDVLVALVERRDRIVGKHELIDLVWPRLVVEENNLQVQMVALRKLFGHAAIVTVPGRGYRFTLVVTVEGELLPQVQAGVTPPDESRSRPGNLPSQWPELIGREDDVRAVLRLLERYALVTIVGAGGIGKTRLAQAVAAAQLDARPDGVWWIDLAALADPAGVANAVAQVMALGVGAGADAVSALWATLPTRAPLLVLDNAEHLLQGVAAFAVKVRREAPSAGVLVTSQEVLHVADEQVFRPEPLALPDDDHPSRVDASAAVALFVARARAASRHFAIGDANRAVVAEICRRLDGIPLAIELAAARVPLLGLDDLRDKLDQRFAVLTGGDRTGLPRHRTLRAALEWSHHLLSTDEQAVLRRLSVFAGGCTLEAAQQVAEDDEGIDCWDVLEHIGALVDKSLVVVAGEPALRYRLLESTRLFALERLIESGEAARVRERHRDHFLERAEREQAQMRTGELRRTLARLDVERENLFLALAWSPGAQDAVAGLRLVNALRYFWPARGMAQRGLEVTLQALARPGADTLVLERCMALAAAAQLSLWCGHFDEARRHVDDSVAMARRLGDEWALCHALGLSASIALRRGDNEQATLSTQESLAIGQRLGDAFDHAIAVQHRASLHGRSGDYDRARECYLQALAMHERLDNRHGMAGAHLGLAVEATLHHRAAAAPPHLQRMLDLLPSVDSGYIRLLVIGATAAWAAEDGQLSHAARLEHAFLSLTRRAGFQRQPDERHVRDIEALRRGLGETAWADAVTAGQAMSLDAAIAGVCEALGPSVTLRNER